MHIRQSLVCHDAFDRIEKAQLVAMDTIHDVGGDLLRQVVEDYLAEGSEIPRKVLTATCL